MAKISRRKFLGILGAGFLGVSSYEIFSKEVIHLEKRDLLVPNWNADGFKVALISDMHISWEKQLNRAIKAIQMAINAKPDVIIFAGDLIETNNNPPQFQNLKIAMDHLTDCLIPSYAIMGNHERSLRNPRTFVKQMKKSPVKLLLNEVIECKGVSLIGLSGSNVGDRSTVFLNDKKISESSIALLHEPDYCEFMAGKASLQLSGHSHGGQICYPLGIPVKRPPGAMKYTSGYYPHAPLPLYVSRGVGTTDLDLRIFCPPEVSILTIKQGYIS